MTRTLLTLTISASILALAGCTSGSMNSKSDTAMASSSMPDKAMAHDGMVANPMVGGAEMSPSRDIIDNAVNSKDHTTLVAAVKAAGLVDTLKGPGPFTVFAPTNAAFAKLPAGTVDKLLEPSMKGDLAKVLTYHVVPGNFDAATLVSRIKAGGGVAKLTTVEGESLSVKAAGKGVTVTDAKGNVANVTIADVRQSNGIIHVIDTVLMP